MSYLTNRILTPELMDRDDVPEADLRQSLDFIRWVNRHLGGSAVVVQHLARWSSTWQPGQTIRVLDIATGSADVPLAIVKWARRRGHHVSVTAMDKHPATLRLAADYLRAHGDPDSIELIRGNALRPPFIANSFDYCVTSMFLHHLGDIHVMTVLKIMEDLASRGLIWNDLLRNRRAYRWCKLLTKWRHPIVRHDAPASVLAGFTRREVVAFRSRLDLHYLQFKRHLFHRFTLAGQHSTKARSV